MDTEQSDNLIKENDSFLLIDNKNHRVILNIKKDKTYSIKKKRFDLKQLIGFPYNTTFEIDAKGELKEVEKEDLDLNLGGEEGEENEKEDEEDDKDEREEPSNKDMFDNNQAQKLTEAEIEEMKKGGLEGKEIISKIIVNSETFQKRTEFSKEKYLRKKKQKHLVRFQIQRITLDNIAETYFLKNAQYIMYFRFDSLGLFLQHAAVGPKSKVLLFDNSHGLLLGGIKQRMLNDGEIYICSPRPQKQDEKEFKIVFELGFKPEDMKNVHYITFKDLEEQKPNDFTHLLIASEIQPEDLLAKTLEYVQGSGSIVIFSPFIEPLGDCFKFFKQNGQAINIRITEVFSREMQVLPLRTHPMMTMQAHSGFVLSAHKIVN